MSHYYQKAQDDLLWTLTFQAFVEGFLVQTLHLPCWIAEDAAFLNTWDSHGYHEVDVVFVNHS